MSAKVFWLILAVIAMIGIALLRYHSSTNTQSIDPHASEEIEKAKQR